MFKSPHTYTHIGVLSTDSLLSHRAVYSGHYWKGSIFLTSAFFLFETGFICLLSSSPHFGLLVAKGKNPPIMLVLWWGGELTRSIMLALAGWFHIGLLTVTAHTHGLLIGIHSWHAVHSHDHYQSGQPPFYHSTAHLLPHTSSSDPATPKQSHLLSQHFTSSSG